ncbi:MAG: hypothetical protein WED10_00760 [Brumimicrobium sp.]
MKKKLIFFLIIFIITTPAYSQFDESQLMKGNSTPTYEEMVEFYSTLADENKDIQLFNMGESDYGLPIYLCLLNGESDSLKSFDKAKEKTTVLINNAIHPGEPCGVNASMQIALEFSKMPKAKKSDFPVVGIIGAYNIGGMKNRGQHSRANQVGPAEHGFRGNAQNLDLNRDFIKMDSKNMFTFANIFHALDPDIFVDTHTSNGADYQYTLTYIAPIKEKLAPTLKTIIYNDLIPQIHKNIPAKWGYDPITYVNMKGKTLDEGIVDYNATARYSMGYVDLFNTISFTTETHMLKPFEDRVRSTYGFLLEIIGYAMTNASKIEKARDDAFEFDLKQKKYFANYKADTVRDSILFDGYEWNHIDSDITEEKRLFYDKKKPFSKYIPHYNSFIPDDTLETPEYFVIQSQEEDIIERLKANKIEMTKLSKDTTIEVQIQRVKEYSTVEKPYEGHYLHYNTNIQKEMKEITFKKGDYLIPSNQKKKRFLVHVLSATFLDSYFNWNFMDSYLQQKEYFSPYVFEEIALDLLNNNTSLKTAFEKKKAQDKSFEESRWEQLLFLYKNSPYYESTHNRLPVFFIL